MKSRSECPHTVTLAISARGDNKTQNLGSPSFLQLRMNFCPRFIVKIILKNSFYLGNLTASSPFCALKCLRSSQVSVPLGDPRSSISRFENMHSSHHILPADGALTHALATFGAGDHMPTLEQDTVNDGIHANAAQAVIFLILQLHPFTI